MKMKTIQRAFAWALTLVMVLSAAPLGVFAEGEGEQKCICTVKCGEERNTECPVCNENAEKCAVTPQKQEDEENKDGGSGTPGVVPPKTDGETPSGGAGGSSKDDTTDTTNTTNTNNSSANSSSTGGGKTSNQTGGSGDGTTTGTGSGSSGSKGTPSDKNGEGSGGSGTGENTGNKTEKKTFSISFNVQGHGNKPEDMTTDENGKLTGGLPALNNVEGFTFVGWYLDKDCSEGKKVENDYPFTANTPLYAKWTENTPTGTGSGSSGSKQDESLEFKKNDNINTSVTYGKITPGDTKVGYTITFNTQGKCAAPQEQETDKDGKLSELPTPTATGYTFGGWYLDDKCSDDQKVENDHPFTTNTELYAKWTPITYTVTFHDNYRNPELIYDQSFDYGSSEQLKFNDTIISRDYYVFDGWAETPDGKIKYGTGSTVKNLCSQQGAKKDLYAVWRYIPRDVIFYACGGTITKDGQEVTSDEVKTQESPLNTVKAEEVPTPTREGYAFLGWYELDTNNKFSLDTPYNTDTTLKAWWVALDKPNNVTLGENFLNENSEKLVAGTEKVVIRAKPAGESDHEQIKNVLGDALDGKKLAVYDLYVQMLKEDGTKLGEFESVNGLIRFDFPVTENVAAVYHGTTPMSVSDGTTPGYLQNGSTLCIWANSFSPYAIVTDGYRITLNTQGGTLAADVPNPMVTDPNGKLQVDLPMPTKTGYTFGGWYRTADCAGNPVKKGDIFDSNATLYAKWTAKPGYTVTFDFNGAVSSVNPYTTDNFGKLSNLPEPKRDGCIFLGWYIGETKVDVNHIYTENTTLVAKWSRNVNSIEVKSDSNGISAPDGFLDGIEIDPGVARIEVVAKSQENEALKEALKRQIENFDKKHVLQFDLSVETQNADGTRIGNLDRVGKLIRFTFENIPGNGIRVFRLHGGNLQELDESTGTTEGYRYSDGTLTIWASQFSPYAIVVNPVAVTVTFDPVGGTVDPKTMTTGTDGKLKENLPTPTRTGYTFDGWYSDKNHTGNKMTQDVTFLRDSTLYAKWNPNTYTVTFHDNYNDPEVKSQQTFTYDVAQSLDCGSTIRRDYYTLSGWAETSGGPKKFAPTETVQSLIPEGNKDLYALWTYEPRRVTFDADGGKIKKDGAEVDKVTVNTQEAPINTVKAADVPVPELREGYYFGGWYTQKNGKGDLVKTGETKEPTVFNRDATVYAYWIVFEPVTVTFKCQGGTARIGSTDVKEFTMQTKWPGVLDGTPSTPGRSGYKFEGWYTAAGVKVDADTLFLRNSTVYARWKRAVSITGNPRTGDQVKLEAAIGILAAAAIGLGTTVVLKKRKEK